MRSEALNKRLKFKSDSEPGKPGAFALWAYRLVRLFLGAVFLYAGAVKISAPHAFADLISTYHLVPGPLLPFAAVGLPLAEMAAGIALMADLKGSLASVAALLALFCLVLYYGILSGLDVDCGCFSNGELAEIGTLKNALWRDIAMLFSVFTLYGFRLAYGRSPRTPAQALALITNALRKEYPR
ncbi:MAG: MauE/DoxX family redox-associated membrane protein [Thermodesulfobacteriota bacterium]